MKRFLRFMMLLGSIFSIAVSFTSCDDGNGPDSNSTPPQEEVDKFADLYGYWLNSDMSGAIQISEGSTSQCKIQYYVYNVNLPQKYDEVTTYYSGENDMFSALYYDEYWGRCYNVTVRIDSYTQNRLILKNSSNGDNLSSYIFTRVSESEFYQYLTNGGNNTVTPSTGISESDFIGIWKYAGSIFNFKQGGSFDLYILTSASSSYYSNLYTGTWKYNSSTKQLVIDCSYSIYDDSWTIKDVTSTTIKTDRMDFTKEYSLPQKEQPEESNRLAGTNWSGRIDGDYVELSFKTNGTFTENYDGDKSTSTYTELDANTIIIGPGTVMYNTFGQSPIKFELNSNKTKLTFSGNYEKWEFTRMQ